MSREHQDHAIIPSKFVWRTGKLTRVYPFNVRAAVQVYPINVRAPVRGEYRRLHLPQLR